MDRLKKIIKKAGTWLVIVCLVIGVISLFSGNSGSSGNGLKKTLSEARNLVGAEEKSSVPNFKIAAGKTATINIPPLRWTPWIVCDGTYFRTSPSGEIKIKFSDGATFTDAPDLIINYAEKTNRMIFKAYNPSPTKTVTLKVTVK
jgi:hypothetical protein